MSGVRVGTRLDHLLKLERRIKLEIEIERRADPSITPVHVEAARTERRIEVTALVVKRWAVSQGLLPKVARGRVANEIVEAYGIAHGTEVTLEASR